MSLIPIMAFSQNRYFTKKGLYEIGVSTDLAKLTILNKDTKLISDPTNNFISQVDTTKNVEKIFKVQKQYITSLYSKMAMGIRTKNFKFSERCGIPEYLNYNDKYALIFSDIMYTHTFNSMKLSTRDRAKEIVINVSNYLFQKIANKVDNRISYIGFCIAYTYRDFSNTYDALKSDCLVIVAPVSAIRSYGLAQITEDEFCLKCDYFINEDGNFLEIKRINLKLF